VTGPHWLPYLLWPLYGLGFATCPAWLIRKLGRDSFLDDFALCFIVGVFWPVVVGVGIVIYLFRWMWGLNK
jgi:hypothetical protein